MTHFRLLAPCPTTWSAVGWRAWHDRLLYGHVAHTCDQHNPPDAGHTGPHTCRCGARLAPPLSQVTPCPFEPPCPPCTPIHTFGPGGDNTPLNLPSMPLPPELPAEWDDPHPMAGCTCPPTNFDPSQHDSTCPHGR
jgi:hypothetical protein